MDNFDKQKDKAKEFLSWLLHPISIDQFFSEYWGRKHLVMKNSKCKDCAGWMKDLFTWKDFSRYMNKYPKVDHLQILNFDDNDGRWCLFKIKNKEKGYENQPRYSKEAIWKMWYKGGKSFVIPIQEYHKKNILDTVKYLEWFFNYMSANIYLSPKPSSKSFPPHADSTENFLFHTEGETKWTMYKEFGSFGGTTDKPLEVIDEFVLKPGDVLYIPTLQYHKAESVTPRISISIHGKDKPGQNLQNFKLGPVSRDEWYDWDFFRYNHQHNNRYKQKEK